MKPKNIATNSTRSFTSNIFEHRAKEPPTTNANIIIVLSALVEFRAITNPFYQNFNTIKNSYRP